MSYKQKLVSAVAAGFAVVSFSAFAAAQDNSANQSTDSTRQEKREHRGGGFGKHDGEGRGGHRRRSGGGEMGMRGLRQLDLTDAQKQQARRIMEANRGKGNPQDFQEMRELSRAKHDGTLTDAQKERLQTLKQQKRQNMEETHRQILAILTDEQRAKLEQLKEQNRGEMRERRQMRRNRQNSDTPNDDN